MYMAKINFKPNEDRVLIEAAEAETKTASGLYIPDTAKEKPQKGKVIAVATAGDTIIPSMADDVMYVPDTDEVIAPLLSTIPLQLLSYYVGIAKGIDVDKPRNLAKSVTVE